MALSKEFKLTVEGKRVTEEMKKLAGLEVAIGFQHGASSEEGVDVCDYAAWNELGTENGIPSRPFMRNSVELHLNEINQFLRGVARQMFSGGTAEKALKQIGSFQKGLMQEEITDGDYEPNAPSTIRKKKSEHPLIDTGLMRQSVNFQVRKKGGGE